MVRIKLLKDLAKWRKSHGVSAESIAKEIGMSLSYISQIESGKIDIRMSTLVRYINAIGVDNLYFTTYEEEKGKI